MRKLLQYLYYYKSISSFKSKGRNVIFSRGGVFIRPHEITIGNSVFINRNFHISARNLKIGNNVLIGSSLVIECDNHKYDKVGMTMFDNRDNRDISEVEIEDDVWIGSHVVILPGVKIREGSIIGAGSIITKSTKPYSISAGNPCKLIKMRFSNENLDLHLEEINKLK